MAAAFASLPWSWWLVERSTECGVNGRGGIGKEAREWLSCEAVTEAGKAFAPRSRLLLVGEAARASAKLVGRRQWPVCMGPMSRPIHGVNAFRWIIDNGPQTKPNSASY